MADRFVRSAAGAESESTRLINSGNGCGRMAPYGLCGWKAKAASIGIAPALELELSSGERLRIGQGVDAETLRLVLKAVRG